MKKLKQFYETLDRGIDFNELSAESMDIIEQSAAYKRYCRNHLDPDDLKALDVEFRKLGFAPDDEISRSNIYLKDNNKAMNLSEYEQMLKDSLDIPVMIDHRQVDKIVITQLIGFRNAPGCSYKDQIDDILKGYYLNDESFQKYVINKEDYETI